MRFPELSVALAQAGAEILTYPSAFGSVTGPAHWEVRDKPHPSRAHRQVASQCLSTGRASSNSQPRTFLRNLVPITLHPLVTAPRPPSPGAAAGPCHRDPVLCCGGRTVWTSPREQNELWPQHGGRSLGHSGGTVLRGPWPLPGPHQPRLSAPAASAPACDAAPQARPLQQPGSAINLGLTWSG